MRYADKPNPSPQGGHYWKRNGGRSWKRFDITEGKKVCDYANIYDATVQVHICGAPVSTAAALHVEAVIPNFIIHEHHTNALKQCVRELCIHDYQPENGRYKVPERPGLGQELNDGVVMNYLAHTFE